MKWLKRHQGWHRLCGHSIVTPVFNPLLYAPHEMVAAAVVVRDECSCGDQWLFNGLSLTVLYVPVNP